MFAITGVSGNTGRAAAQALLDQGERVRVVVRHRDRGAEWEARGAEVAVADVTDADALTRALEGTRGAYLLNPPKHGDTDPFGLARQVGQAIRTALDRRVTGRAVVLSSVGAQQPRGTGMVGSVHIVEGLVRGAAVPVTFLRPAYFAENWSAVLPLARAEDRLPTFLRGPVATVGAPDIGRLAAELLLAPETPDFVELAGPTDPTPEEVAAVVGRILDREVELAPIPRDQWASVIDTWGVTPIVRDNLAELYDGINQGVVDFENPARVRRSTTSLEATFRGLLN